MRNLRDFIVSHRVNRDYGEYCLIILINAIKVHNISSDDNDYISYCCVRLVITFGGWEKLRIIHRISSIEDRMISISFERTNMSYLYDSDIDDKAYLQIRCRFRTMIQPPNPRRVKKDIQRKQKRIAAVNNVYLRLGECLSFHVLPELKDVTNIDTFVSKFFEKLINGNTLDVVNLLRTYRNT